MAPAAPRDLVAIVDSRHPQDGAAASNRYHPRAGFVFAPEDKRKVPLVAFTNQDVPCQSFALLAAEAYAAVLHWPSIMDRLDKSTEGGQQFVYSEVVLEYSRQCRLLGAISTPRGVQWADLSAPEGDQSYAEDEETWSYRLLHSALRGRFARRAD